MSSFDVEEGNRINKIMMSSSSWGGWGITFIVGSGLWYLIGEMKFTSTWASWAPKVEQAQLMALVGIGMQLNGLKEYLVWWVNRLDAAEIRRENQ